MSVNNLAIAQQYVPTLNTSVYQDVLHNADSMGNYNYWGISGDGVATKQELQSYGQQLNWQVDILNWWKNSGWGGNQIDQLLKDLKDQKTATGVMIQNFGSFANNSGNGTAINQDDIKTTAKRDGKASNVSNYDVRHGSTTPPNPWPPIWHPNPWGIIPMSGSAEFML